MKRLCIGLLVGLFVCVAALPLSGRAAEPLPMLARGTVLHRPLTVMIDNHQDAVPQSGFGRAAVVFEALAEGGITRFMMVFHSNHTLPESIGPVRSTRLYYAQWAMGFDAIHMHAGGSPEGLALIESSTETVNADALYRSGGAYFYRSNVNVAPHNLYTGAQQFYQFLWDKGIGPMLPDTMDADGNWHPTFHPDLGYVYRGDGDASQRPAGMTVRYYFLNSYTSATWTYDANANAYLRWVAGKPAIDADGNQQIMTKNLIVMEAASQRIVGDEKGRIDVGSIGSGPAKLYHDGMVLDIEWRKTDAGAPLLFYYLDGVTEVRMVNGPMWIAVVPSLSHITDW
jgi:hypothetical protein